MRPMFSGAREMFGHIYGDPFRADSRLGELSAAEAERRRRSQLARLIIISLTAVQGVSLVGQILGVAPTPVVIAQVVALALGVFALLLNAGGHTTLASLLYIVTSAASVIFASLESAPQLDGRGLAIYGLLSIFLVLSGLLLPPWAIWLTVLLIIGAMGTTLALRPIAPNLIVDAPNLGTGDDVRFLLGGILSVTYLAVALLTWVFARSSFASTLAIARAYQRERELAALKDQFIVDANHELRTPMMALYGNVELALVLSERGTVEERERLLQRALRAGDTVLRLLNSVLDAGVLEAGQFRVTPGVVTLRPLVISVLETFDPREVGEPYFDMQHSGSRSVQVDVPDTLQVIADEIRLRQILVNLLSNALKYSASGTPLAIAAHRLAMTESAAAPDGEVQIDVRDKGLGVPPTDAAKLFQRFVRLERDIAGPVRGTGVGLYLCRELTQAMGGHIWVESSGVAGEGSTFSFTLPAVARADAPVADDAALSPVGQAHFVG